jgi:D-glycero-D-manno-heptose 1,7-bisphosphate phosphatase
MEARPAVFLDRDGTLNVQLVREGKPYAPDRLEDFRLYEGVAEGCQSLKEAGFALVVVTNQPEVGRGTIRAEVIEAMHGRLRQWVPEIERVEACFDPGRGEPSRRRKPEPGMVFDAAEALGLDLARSWMVGDRWRDVDCGKRAGLRTVFIDFGYAESLESKPDHTVGTFREAVSVILAASLRPP